MEKITKSRFESLPPIKLYLDDIEKIVDILRELSSEIKIETEEYALKDVNEFASLNKEKLAELRIRSLEPHLSLDLGPRHVWLDIAEDIPSSRGTFEKIKEVLLSRRRKFAGFAGNLEGGLIVSLILGFATISMGLKAIEGGGALFSIGAVIMLLISLVFGRWYFRVISKESSLIILKRRNQQQSFFQRNKDRIIVGIILALASGFIGWVLRTLIK